jgi:GAF domain-containing protein
VNPETTIRDLHDALRASRTTLRIDTPGEVFPVVAEAAAPGVRSLRHATEIDLRAAATFRWLDRKHATLVQRDCLEDDPVAPPELIELYGVRAQILVPLVRDGRLVGIVSVHHAGTPRNWTPDEVRAAEDAATSILAALP